MKQINAGSLLAQMRWKGKNKKQRMEVNRMLNAARKAKRQGVHKQQNAS